MKPQKPGTALDAPDSPPQNIVHPSTDLLPHPDVRQQAAFLKGRESGMESMFRARKCDGCGVETPKQFRFCSVECYDKDLEAAKEGQ